MAASSNVPPESISKVVHSADGTPIYAEALGDPSKPALVFIHGFVVSLICFDDIFSDPKWREAVYLIRYDTRGHGRSGKPDAAEAYESRRMSEDYMAVTAAFGVTKAFIVGWSMGGSFAADVCAHPGPDVLHGIVFMDCVPFCQPAVVMGITTPALGALVPGLLTTDDVALFSRTILEFIESCAYDKTRMSYRTRAALLGDSILQPPAVRNAAFTRTTDPAPFLKAGATLPLLFLHGREDEHLVAERVLEVIQPSFGERLEVHILEGVGHGPFIDAPEKTRELVLDFVKRVVGNV
ncbi:alpha/beta-hydrolase [Calocera cornea HHB12733]|uniref:Alpha/beta-hydrolase n=1 Tax=Calocera cornea HHB12733 TaxID=1353952 RepID=A0A165DHY1_9BASI|nr:alpha/beta-hydrolase [Calocera cornea HHB12733]